MDKNFLTFAKALAVSAHLGQTDKSDRPYIEHVTRVAARVSFWPEAEVVAWLHDVIEDHPEHEQEITLHFPANVVSALALLDRNSAPNETAYYQRIYDNRLAFVVKLSDIADNADEDRLAMLDEATQVRLREKYRRARKSLGAGELAPAQPTC